MHLSILCSIYFLHNFIKQLIYLYHYSEKQISQNGSWELTSDFFVGSGFFIEVLSLLQNKMLWARQKIFYVFFIVQKTCFQRVYSVYYQQKIFISVKVGNMHLYQYAITTTPKYSASFLFNK